MMEHIAELDILHCDVGHEDMIKDLKRKHEFIISLLNAITDEMCVINRDMKIVWSKDKNLIGKMAEDICNSQKRLKHISSVFDTRVAQKFETEKDGRYYSHIVSLCNANGEVSTVLEMRRDITESKKIEEMKQLEELVNRVIISQEKLAEQLNKKEDKPVVIK